MSNKKEPIYYNLFQGNDSLMKVVCNVLGFKYEYDNNGYLVSKEGKSLITFVTEDIYFQTYFYLCNRFGAPKILDHEYKKTMIWDFLVKENYKIRIELNGTWVSFIIFAKNRSKGISKRNTYLYSRTPYNVRYNRNEVKYKNKLVNILSPLNESKASKNIKNKIWDKFLKEHGIDDTWTPERFNKEKSIEWFKYVQEYNNSFCTEGCEQLKDRKEYSSSYSRHALRTMRQFLNNMLTPIYVRDVQFNIKGWSKGDFSRFENNIKIEFIN